MKHPRVAIGALSLSAAAFVGLALKEGYTDRAVIPVKGDVPTVGFGSTKREDGSAVTMDETITPPKALSRSLNHIAKDEAGLKRCVTGPLLQAEYDLLVDHAYQYGVATTCRSPMVRAINAGRYAESCEGYLAYKFVAGYDCSTPGNRICAGVWKRSQERHRQCVEAVGPPALGATG